MNICILFCAQFVSICQGWIKGENKNLSIQFQPKNSSRSLDITILNGTILVIESQSLP